MRWTATHSDGFFLVQICSHWTKLTYYPLHLYLMAVVFSTASYDHCAGDLPSVRFPAGAPLVHTAGCQTAVCWSEESGVGQSGDGVWFFTNTWPTIIVLFWLQCHSILYIPYFQELKLINIDQTMKEFLRHIISVSFHFRLSFQFHILNGTETNTFWRKLTIQVHN